MFRVLNLFPSSGDWLTLYWLIESGVTELYDCTLTTGKYLSAIYSHVHRSRLHQIFLRKRTEFIIIETNLFCVGLMQNGS